MRSFVLLASLVLATSPAFAQGAPSNADIERRLSADGYRIVQIERYPETIEVRAFDTAGACVELHLHPSSGKIQYSESDNRCTTNGSGNHGGRHGGSHGGEDDHGHHGGHHG